MTTFDRLLQVHSVAARPSMRALLQRALLWLIDAVAATPRLVVLATALLSVWALAYTLANLRIDTDTTDMISAKVPFRQHDSAFRQAFPEFTNPIVAVIEGRAPERVQTAARALADALRADDAHFSAVDYPQGQPFFARNGLLYPRGRRARRADRPPGRGAAAPGGAGRRSEPARPRGVRRLVLEHEASDGALPAELDGLFGDMAAAVEAQRDGRPGEAVLAQHARPGRRACDRAPAGACPAAPRLRVAGACQPGDRGPARCGRCRLDIDPAHGLQLHLTGGAVLEDEELQSVGAGALTASVLTTAAVALLLLWGLRSWRLIVATLVTLVVGLIFTAAFTALAIGRLNLISVTFAVLFVGLGVDFGIHVVLRYQEKIRTAPTPAPGDRARGTERRRRAHAQRAVRRARLSELRADRLSGPRRARHHLGLRHAGGLVHQPHPAAGAACA